MEAGIKVGLHNRFDIEVRDAKTNKLKETATAYNIVLNAMWSRLVNRQSFMSAIHIGTGTGILDPSRTSLFTFLVGRTATLDGTSTNINNIYRRVKIQLEPAEFVGSNISEVGVAYNIESATLVTHAMLTDSEGSPITITKTDTDVVIIYATVFFTVGTLPDYVKLAGVRPNGNVGGNQLLSYLLSNGGSSIESTIRIGTYAATDAETLPNILIGGEVASKSASLTTDVANKRINFPIRRFEIAEANGHIQEFGIGGSFNVVIPNDNYTGTQYDDIILTGQDGAKTTFILPSANIDSATVVAKINNAETEVSIIDLPYYNDYFISGVNDICDSYTTYGEEVLWCGDLSDQHIFKLNKSIDGFYYVDKYQGGFGREVTYINASSELLIVAPFNAPGALFAMSDLPNTPRTPLRTFSISYNVYFPGFNPDNTAAFYVVSNTLRVMRYNGTAWTGPDALLTLTAATQGTLGTSIFSPTEPLLFVGAGSNAGVSFRLYNYDYGTNSVTQITFPSATENSRAAFSSDGQMFVAYAKTPGIRTFEKVDEEWVLTDAIPTTEVLYTSLNFVGNLCLVGYNSANGSVTVWKKVDDVWELISTQFDIFSTANTANSYSSATFGATSSGTLIPYTTVSQQSYTGRGLCVNTWGRKAIKFDTAPAAEDEIKVSYKVNGIHKTTNYVLDVSGYIQFGEG